MFTECPVVASFWGDIKNHVTRTTNFNLTITTLDIILGYLIMQQNNNPINALILVTKKHIFNAFTNNTNLNLNRLISNFKQFYTEEKLLAILRNKHEKFCKTWNTWEKLFE